MLGSPNSLVCIFYNFTGSCGIERVSELQHAYPGPVQKYAEMHIAVVYKPVGVVLFKDDFSCFTA